MSPCRLSAVMTLQSCRPALQNCVLGCKQLLKRLNLRPLALCLLSQLVFSSSACVYGAAQAPINESAPLQPLNPYGHSKVGLLNST